MFDFVRKHTKIMMFLMFLLIIPAFVLVGVDGFRSVDGGSETVAVVAGNKVTQAEWDAVHRNEVDRLRQTMPGLDPKLLDSPEARFSSLERIVRDRLVSKAIEDMHLGASNERLIRVFRDSPEFAGLRRPDGTLDAERYRQLAQREGMSTEMLDISIRRQLSERQLEGSVPGTSIASESVINSAMNAFNARREVQVQAFTPASFASKVSLTDAEVESYYQANPVFFKALEQAVVEYVVLDLESVQKTIRINEQDLRAYYEQNVGSLSGKEERRASHILIAAAKSAPAEEREKAREKANALLETVRKAPDSFAEVARKNSQDPGSAANGGDLDYFVRGAMVKPFEDAAFSMKKGDISPVVESDFGFHIIRLTDVKSPKTKTFEELRASIEADLVQQEARRKFAEASETFSNSVYEQPEDYKAVMEKLKLEPRKAPGVRRSPAIGATGALANPKLLEALFSPESIEKKRNTEAVEVGPNQLASARIVEYTPAQTRPFAQVKDEARQRLIGTRAAELARKEGASKLDAWKGGQADVSLPNPVIASRTGTPVLPPKVLNAAMVADASKLPAWVGVDLGEQGYAVVRINKVLDRAAPADAQREKIQFVQWQANAEALGYYEWLKTRYKVEMRAKRPQPSAGSAS